MTPLIHKKINVIELSIERDPEIMREKERFIRRNYKIFRFIFVTDYVWRHENKWGGNWSMKARMASVISRCYGPKGEMMAEQIRQIFGYAQTTSVDTILFTWRRLYFKIYPDEQLYNGKRIC